MDEKVAVVKAAKAKIMKLMEDFFDQDHANHTDNRAYNLATYLENRFNDELDQKDMAEIMKITGLDIKPFLSPGEGQTIYKKGMVVVPFHDEEGKYIKGQPALVYWENCGIHFDRKGKLVSGARLPEVEKFSNRDCRLATRSEVSKFFDRIEKAAPNTEWFTIDKVTRAARG